MAIIPLGLCTIPSIRNVSTIRPAFPGGRFSGVAFAVRALVRSVSNGSRRTNGAFSSADFSAGGLAVFPAGVFVASLPATGAFAGPFAESFAAAGALAGALVWAGAGRLAGAGAEACGALCGWGSPGVCFISWSRTALGWTFGCSWAKVHVARTAERASGNRVRDDFASRIVSRLDSTYLRAG